MRAALADGRHHIVAPPGSGKTVLGLELARRLRDRTVVFAPTTVIQQQWLTTVEQFLPAGTVRASFASDDPALPAPIAVFAYQLLAAPDVADRAFDDLARERWRDGLVESGVAADPAAADTRIADLATD
ncbi:MAG: DEAD/DEAH box helicase family protein, partial [Thermoleophilia bacterium]|nr:DEAD/DEAH box helicase family protein [Thermoleophilia bacterium]